MATIYLKQGINYLFMITISCFFVGLCTCQSELTYFNVSFKTGLYIFTKNIIDQLVQVNNGATELRWINRTIRSGDVELYVCSLALCGSSYRQGCLELRVGWNYSHLRFPLRNTRKSLNQTNLTDQKLPLEHQCASKLF